MAISAHGNRRFFDRLPKIYAGSCLSATIDRCDNLCCLAGCRSKIAQNAGKHPRRIEPRKEVSHGGSELGRGLVGIAVAAVALLCAGPHKRRRSVTIGMAPQDNHDKHCHDRSHSRLKLLEKHLPKTASTHIKFQLEWEQLHVRPAGHQLQ